MKKRVMWLTAILAASGLYALAEVVITSPTGLPDESDVVLESTVDAVKEIPGDVVQVVGDTIAFAGDELRNTANGIAWPFKGDPRETARQGLLNEVDGSWDRSGDIVFHSYKISPAIVRALQEEDASQEGLLDVSSFFNRVEFSAGTSACLQPEYGRLLVRQTPENLLRIENKLAQYHRAELDYKQVSIKAKFIEVSQSTLNQLGFSWRIEDAAGADGVRLVDNLQVLDNQDIFSAGLRSATTAFGGAPGAGSMVLTKTGWMPLRLAISALEQSSDSDVLSAPSLTTMDGKAAEIWVGEDREVPKSFEVRSQDTNIHIEHQNWDSELMGVHFSVTPEILKNNLIRLELNPKVIDLIGYDTYQVSPQASMMALNGYGMNTHQVSGRFPILNVPAAGISSAWDLMAATLSPLSGGNGDPNDLQQMQTIAGQTPPNGSTDSPNQGYYNQDRKATHGEMGIPLNAVNGHLPYFRIREIKTQVDVADGSTVGLGGLIYDRLETYKDKVPVLGSIPLIGRLFRSEGEKSIKRNLMIFVTASQVDANGQLKSSVAINN